tara:strand:+ start:2690 stop:4873 length:2184 start_codon:yes stop_codon:yes gene_type:complete
MSKTFPVNNFSGGLVDYIFNNPPPFNMAEICENFLPLPDNSIEVRPGSTFYNQDKPRYCTGRINKIFKVQSELLAISSQSLYNSSGEIFGPTGNKAFFDGFNLSKFSVAKLGDEYFVSDSNYSQPVKLYKNQTNTTVMRTAGLPEISTTPTGTPSNDDSKSYVYAVVFKQTYYTGSTLRVDYGKPYYFFVDNASDFTQASRKIDLSNLPVITNGITSNYDTSNIVLEIYRTTSDSGNTYYLVDEVINGVNTYEDTTTDEAIVNNNITLYVNDGSVDNDAPPRAKYLVRSNNAIWYLNVKENGEVRSNRLKQSIQNDGDSVPADFFTEVDADITGGGSINDRLIVFTDSKTYRVDGILSESGSGSLTPVNISETFGCTSHDSIVKTNEGLYFISEDGFCFTDGYKVIKISDHINETHRAILNYIPYINGAYDAFNRRIYWSLRESTEDNDTIIFYDERKKGFWRVKGTTMYPTSIIYDDNLIRADKYGYIYEHDDSLYTDLVYSATNPTSEWVEEPIIYRWKSAAWDLGFYNLYKWITKITVAGKPDTNVDFAVRTYNEGSVDYKELTSTNFRPELEWSDETLEWSDETLLWNAIIFLNKTRRFPRGSLRAKHRQIEITNAYIEIKSSVEDTNSYVTVNSSSKAISLVAPDDYKFGLNYEGYNITIDQKDYKILSGSESALIVSDTSNTLVDGTYPYSIKGYPKGQRAHIHNLVLHYTLLDDDGGFPE